MRVRKGVSWILTTSGILGGPVSQNKGRSTLVLGRYLADAAEVLAESENKLSQTRRVKASAE